MRKHMVTSIIFAVILLSLSGCMGIHHLSHANLGTTNHETANYATTNHGTGNYYGGCH